MDEVVLVYTTYPSLVEAEQAGRRLVESRLAACVNILPHMVSIYRWKEAVERADEVVMLVKTRAVLADEVREAVRRGHSYELPAIMVLPVSGGDADYLGWIRAESAGAAEG
jgi:periplasmic divalent cation tolerance protein